MHAGRVGDGDVGRVCASVRGGGAPLPQLAQSPACAIRSAAPIFVSVAMATPDASSPPMEARFAATCWAGGCTTGCQT